MHIWSGTSASQSRRLVCARATGSRRDLTRLGSQNHRCTLIIRCRRGLEYGTYDVYAKRGHVRLVGRQQTGATGIVTTRSDDRARIYTAPPEPQLQTAAVVGLEQPAVALATQFVKSGFTVLGIDSDHERVRASEQSPVLRAAVARRRFAASTDFSMIRRANLVVVCVDARVDSDAAVAALVDASVRVAPHIDRGTVIVIEAVSPTHPVCRALASLFEHESGLGGSSRTRSRATSRAL